ncbi:MAG TPA: hypothetical protein VIN73_07010 [Vicingaceae bacterium]
MPDITLLTKTGRMHNTGGLNWGSNALNHTRPYDSYIPIHIGTIRANPGLFDRKPAQQVIMNFHWDDGTIMQGIFGGNGPDGYPKQLESKPSKDVLGIYLRNRLGLPATRRISLQDLLNYGRTTVTIQRIDNTNYSLNFS